MRRRPGAAGFAVLPLVGLRGGVRRVLWIGMAGAVVTLVASALLFYAFEHGRNTQVTSVGSGFIWVTRTLLEQSSPWNIVSGAATIVYYVVLIAGVSLAAMATAAIASKLVEIVIKRGGGMGNAQHLHGHIVICGWNSKGPEILRELHADEVEDKRPVVILAPVQQSPTRDKLTVFLSGSPATTEDLTRASIDRADTAIILADDSNPTATADDIDAKTLLTALAVETLAPGIHSCVEVLRSENRQHFERTKANELIVSSELAGALLAASASTHGISRVFHDLVTHPEGNEFYAVPTPADLVGRTFGDALVEMKRRYDCVLMAVATGEEDFEINPASERALASGERLLVIARESPEDAIRAGARA